MLRRKIPSTSSLFMMEREYDVPFVKVSQLKTRLVSYFNTPKSIPDTKNTVFGFCATTIGINTRIFVWMISWKIDELVVCFFFQCLNVSQYNTSLSRISKPQLSTLAYFFNSTLYVLINFYWIHKKWGQAENCGKFGIVVILNNSIQMEFNEGKINPGDNPELNNKLWVSPKDNLYP